MAELSSRLECCICSEVVCAPHSVSPCGHVTCGLCCLEWLVKQPAATRSCPHCRAVLDGPPAPVRELDNVVHVSRGRASADPAGT